MKKIIIILAILTATFGALAETLFEVKDASNNKVLDVSTDGLRILNLGDTLMVISSSEIKAVLESSKGLSRSFSVTTSSSKGSDNDLMRLTSDSTRFWISDTGSGFGVSNQAASQKGVQTNLLEVNSGSTTMREGVDGDEYTNFSPKNIFIGLNAGASTTLGVPYSYSGMFNLFIGNFAGQSNTSGYFNTYTGYMAGNASTTATHNTFYGYQAGMNNMTGSYNSAIGYQAGYEMTGGYNNNVMGYRAGYLTSTGHDNIFMGTEAGWSNSSGDYNVALGYNAGHGLSDGNSNIFMGYESGLSTTNGDNNLFLGYQSGRNTTVGNGNIFIGYETGEANISGNNNTFMGFQAGKSNTTGNYNLFIGYSSGSLNVSGEENLFIGYASGTSNTAGTGNVNLGTYSGQVTTGSENVMIGRGAGCYATSANNNVFIGHSAGYGNGVEDGNVFIGYHVGYSNVGSNKLMIDNSDVNAATSLIYGDFATNALTFNTNTTSVVHPIGSNYGLYIQNSYNSNTDSWHFYQFSSDELALYYNTSQRGSWNTTTGVYTAISDERLKKNVEDMKSVTEKVMKLQPKRYNFTTQKAGEKKYIGLIAQDVEKQFPEFVFYHEESDTYTMDYAGLSVVAIQAIKEQQTEIDDLRAQINELRELIKNK